MSWCSRKSNSISNTRSPYGMAEVVKPRALTYSATFHQWLILGLSASRTLPTICVHMCSVSRVSCHAERGKAGQQTGESETAVLRTSVMRPLQTDSIVAATDSARVQLTMLYSIARTWVDWSALRVNSLVCSSRIECAARNHSAKTPHGRSVSSATTLVNAFLLPRRLQFKERSCLLARR